MDHCLAVLIDLQVQVLLLLGTHSVYTDTYKDMYIQSKQK